VTTVAVIQARMGSRRLPGKTLMDVTGRPLIARVIDRAVRIAGVDGVVVATTTRAEDDAVVRCARACGVTTFAGDEADVLDRFHRAAADSRADVVVRLTADCPLLDPDVSSAVLRLFLAEGLDYASNVHPPTYPDGLDTEVFSREALQRAWQSAVLDAEREHVTPYLWSRPELFKCGCVVGASDLSQHRWTVDEAADLAFVRTVYDALEPQHGGVFGHEQVLALVNARPGMARLAGRHDRGHGYLHSVPAHRVD
jgi:spore coat polysaccharide biosynthesis protein SpsF